MVLHKVIFCIGMLLVSFTYAQDYKEVIRHLENKADTHFYTDQDSTYYYYNRIYALSTAQGDFITAIDNLNYLCESAGYHYDMNTLNETIETIDRLIKEHKGVLDTLPDKGDFQKNYLYYNTGNYHNKLENYTLAQESFQKIEKNITQKTDFSENPDDVGFLSTAYSYIAKMNSVQHRFKTSDDYYQKNIRLLEKYIPEDKDNLYKVFNLYANSLYRQKKYQEAKELWRRSFLHNVANYTPDNKNSIVSTGLLLSKVYGELNQLDSANYFIAKTHSYQIPKHFVHRYLTTSGDIKGMEEKFDDAQYLFLEALGLADQVNKPLISLKLGNLLAKQKKNDSALSYYQDGLKNISKVFTSNNLEDNPVPKYVIKKQEFIRILKQKSLALNAKPTLENYHRNLNVIETAITTIDLLKPSFKNDKDKVFLIDNAYPIFESGLETTYNLYRSSENEHYINEAFRYAEKSKSVLLLEALLSSQATKFANIPKDILERENELKSAITRTERKLTSSDTPDVFLKDELFDLRQEHRNLMVDIETNYPAYFNLKYGSHVLSLPEIQEKLTDNELLISYFYGNENSYTLAASRHQQYFEKIPISTELEAKIKSLHRMLSDSKSNQDSLSSVSHSLYLELLAPVLDVFPQEKVIIVPDGLLNYIPFGSLVTNLNKNRYFVEDRAISYVNSATLWSRLNSTEQLETKLLAFAPSFSPNAQSDDKRAVTLGKLPHNREEVAQILASFKGDSFIGNEATLQNFKASISDYSVLHLATHAVFDDENPENSYLAFTPKSNLENQLFVKDLYNLTLNASLVALSACESGIGELKRGEGFLSLARGFFYSGASSIASTLWKVNDNSSSVIMGRFYKNLADGKTKDEALREAKRWFLEKNRENGLSHPYYWSGYLIQGNTKALVTSKNWQWYIFASIIVLFIFLGRKRLLQLVK
ncbi:CHAT domain-containing protein [Maribacter antarcticus]|uniref:CHAT domain-containing protein n=1 Tax=Maribacter antarcticus TaxID=505250 RepID=UPI000686EFF9|nr:CHAT domain-containing tetratricopeptide repeat protein [Maribacter antarcticus]